MCEIGLMIKDIEALKEKTVFFSCAAVSYNIQLNIHSNIEMILVCLKKHMYYIYSENLCSEWNLYSIEDKSIYCKYQKVFNHSTDVLDYDMLGKVIDEGEKRIIFSFETRSIMLLNKISMEIYVIGFDFRDLFIDTYKCLRRYFTWKSYNESWCLLHASGVVNNNKGIIFVGDKGSGKTTFAAYFMSLNNRQGFIGNDRIWIVHDRNKCSSDSPNIAAWPTVMPIGIGTLRSLIEYHQHINPDLHFHGNGIAMLLHNYKLIEKDAFANVDNKKNKQPLTPQEISWLFQVNLIAESKLNYLIFPTISENVEFFISEIGVEEAETLLRKNILYGLKNHGNWLGLSGKDDCKLAEESLKYLKHVLFRIEKIYKININKDLFENDMKKVYNIIFKE
jgi:hypothetical protein